MHRSVDICVPSNVTDRLIAELSAQAEVTGLSVSRGVSIKPVGDVLIVHVLNRGIDAVLDAVAKHAGDEFSIATAEVASLIDPQHDAAVERDVDEAVWEEMETGLRHQGRITANFVALMGLGGVIAAAGLVAQSTPQAVALVAAAIIAPGFEPIAKIPLGMVLQRWNVVGRGLKSLVVGYLVLIASAALAFWVLHGVGAIDMADFTENSAVKQLGHPTAAEILVSVCAATAGAIMIASYRRSVIAGPLIALSLIHAAAAVGMALACGRIDIALDGLLRLGIDAALVVAAGGAVFAWKQATVHRRKPLV